MKKKRQRREADISKIFEDKFVRSAYFHIVKSAYGASSVALANRILNEVQRNGEAALNKYCPPATDVPHDSRRTRPGKRPRSAFFDAAMGFGLISKRYALSCEIRCEANFVACCRGCEALPGWGASIACEIACGLQLLACLSRCRS